MATDDTFRINPALAEEIEDAVMFGRPGELEAIVENLEDDKAFPAELRQGLQSLTYFRAHYSRETLADTDKKKVNLMDSAWAMELLNKIRARIEAAVKRA